MSARAAIIEGVIRPDDGGLSSEAANYLLSLHFTDEQKDQFDALSEKARAGTLTQDERDVLDEFLRTETLLMILKAKARRSLPAGSSPAA